MKYNYILIVLLALFPLHQSKAQCPTLSSNITPVVCTNGATGAITLSVSGDTANVSNPGLLISEMHTDPPLADSPKEWVELIATRSINFAQTPYTVIFSNNGTATSKGWVEGNIPSPPPRNSTYAFQINTGSVQPGDIVYVGGTSMAPTVLRLREKNTSTEAGDGGIGGAFTGASGVLGNGGGVADGIAVFNLPVAQIDSNTVPVDAIFYGSGIGDAALADTTRGFRLPVNDRYSGGRLKSSSFLAPEVLAFYSLQANGAYERSAGVYSTTRTWTTNTSAWASASSGITVSGNTYLWSNGATTKDLSGLTAGTYTVTVTSGSCTVNSSYTVTQSAALNVALTSGSVICNGATNGSISSSVGGGATPYTYLWSNGAIASGISNLAAGTYTLTVTDANGCASTQSAAVQQTAAVNVTSISPAQNSSGYPVALRGSGLAGITQVKFNGVNAATFTISGDTLITATVPVNAGSGPIQLLSSNGCEYQTSLSFTYLFSSPDLTVKLYIEGLYVGGGYMELPLVNSGLSGNAQHCDSITLQLAQPTAPYAIAWTGRVLLRSNGTAITNIPGTVIGQSYFVIAKHRSSIETWSKQPVVFGPNTYWNFSGVSQFPSLSTTAVSSVQNATAISGGTISSDGGSAVTTRGVCWSILPSPTIALNTKTIDGSGTGSFTSNISGLSINTTYYVRAYATNAVGTAYGNEISFTTLNLPVDIDGNVYDTVVIGTQVWMNKNLRVSKYRNGDPIPTNLNNTDWQNTTSGAYAIYNDSTTNNSIYGKLYNWYAVADPRGLCPVGWHVPSDAEWQTLETALGMPAAELNLTSTRGSAQNVGGQMKSVSPLWQAPNTNATNSSGFSGLPGGYRWASGTYANIGNGGAWWSSTQYSTTSAWYRGLSYNYGVVARNYFNKIYDFSVRCVRDVLPTLNTTSVSGISGTTANSGGTINDAGGDSVTVRGVVWSTTPGPTVALPTKTSNGTGTGSFTSNLSGLSPGTTYYVRAYATNGAGTAYGAELSFTTLNVPQISTFALSLITNTSAQSGGSIITDGGSSVTVRGVCWSTSPGPTVLLPTKTSNGTGTGSFTSNLTGLSAGTTYYMRAYATNGAGTAYGAELSFTTLNVPQISTFALSLITNTSAQSGGSIITDGGSAVTARGVCWSTSPGPTVALATKTSNGSGTGGFTSNISGLSKNTTYYVRAYATNAVGTAYGNEISFTTLNLLTDIDGNVYDTVVIGTQVWMSKNLRVSKYRNGDLIPTNLINTTWQNTTSGAYAIYDNTTANDSIYGKLYNWYAVADPRGLCPTGWHVPSEAEWTTLENFLGGSLVAGGAMKAVSPLWLSPNTGATNSSGFSGLPGGYRFNDGTYNFIGSYGDWWSSTQNSATYAWYRYLYSSSGSVNRYFVNKRDGYSVRCVRD